jgi:hypothetical protein
MSNEDDKMKHSSRLHKDEAAISKQVRIAKQHHQTNYLKEPHRLAKRHAMDCGQPACRLCSSERKLNGTETLQEQSHKQAKLWDEARWSDSDDTL